MKDSEWYRAWYMMLGASKRQMIRERFDGKQVLMSEWMMSLKTDDAAVVSDLQLIFYFTKRVLSNILTVRENTTSR